VLYGAADNDTLTGGAGVDTLVGETGNDVFVLANTYSGAFTSGTATTAGWDVITDFKVTVDKIQTTLGTVSASIPTAANRPMPWPRPPPTATSPAIQERMWWPSRSVQTPMCSST